MHMADTLISPIVGGSMLAVTAGIIVYSVKKVQSEEDDKKVPLMGVMGAFIFAVQMINFSIPGTGSSGHLVGGILLAALLGPYAGFLTVASVLLIQALFFADGGLLAYGCNVFNLGFFPCFIAYSLIYKPLIKKQINNKRLLIASLLSSVIGLQLSAFSVVLETLLSGKTELPFRSFVLVMQSIHLPIGIAEGLVTSAIIGFVWKVRPEIINNATFSQAIKRVPMKKVFICFLVGIILTIGGFSLISSSNPDGLEWSIEKVTGTHVKFD